MGKYKCNFCGKADIPTQAGLKVHIQLSKAGCREAMERQMNRSLSPESDSATTIPARQDNSYGSNDTPVDELPPFVPSPRHIDSPEPEPTGNVHQSKRARVEDVEDEDNYNRYARDFPTPTEEFGEAKTTFEEIFEEQRAKGESPWTPFADKDEWELARWLVKNANQRATEEFLKMPGVST